MKRVTGLVLVAGVLSGCVSTSANKVNELSGSSPYLINQTQNKPRACEPLSRDQELALNLSREMVTGKRLHAALANLERLPSELPEARLGKAQVLRLLSRSEAEGLYQSLLDTCLVAEGHHGLAQMAVLQNDNKEALQHLQQAIGFEPTNEAMRNDLGVVYMNQRKLDEARFEFLTAIELNEREQRSLRNLLALVLYQDNFDAAAKLTSRYQLSSGQYQAAFGRAQEMKQEDSQRQPVRRTIASRDAERATPVAAVVSKFNTQPAPAPSFQAQAGTAQPVTGSANTRAVAPTFSMERNAPELAQQPNEEGTEVESEAVSSLQSMSAGVQGVQRIQAASQPIVPIIVR